MKGVASAQKIRDFSQVRKRLVEWNNLVARGGYLETFERPMGAHRV
jgi:hypothetical protein